MLRPLLVVSICASVSCGHPRVAIVGGMTLVGTVGVGLPLSQDCAEHAEGDCGFGHDAKYLAAGALVGATLGLLAQYEYARQTKHSKEKQAKDWKPLPEDYERIPPAVPYPGVDPDVENLDAPHLGPIPTCARDFRDQVDGLARGCRLELAGTLVDLCKPPTEQTCAEITSTVHVLGFAIGEESLATAEATAQAERKCWEADGVAGTADVRCECGNTCGCVADLECL